MWAEGESPKETGRECAVCSPSSVPVERDFFLCLQSGWGLESESNSDTSIRAKHTLLYFQQLLPPSHLLINLGITLLAASNLLVFKMQACPGCRRCSKCVCCPCLRPSQTSVCG